MLKSDIKSCFRLSRQTHFSRVEAPLTLLNKQQKLVFLVMLDTYVFGIQDNISFL